MEEAHTKELAEQSLYSTWLKMADSMFKWLVILLALVFGVGLLLNPTIFMPLPRFVHYLAGILFIIAALFFGYKEIA